MVVIDSTRIKAWGRELGFDLVGITPAAKAGPQQEEALRFYLEQGYHGNMTYLARNVATRLDVRRLVKGARSVICAAVNYYRAGDCGITEGHSYKVARYARGRDYHLVLREKLHRLARRIQNAVGGGHYRCFVDTAPLLEKALAARAGLGWIGRHGLLVNERLGSWLVLGEIVTDMELDYDQPVPGRCGNCRRCLDACPTGALLHERILDARKCLSYLTVERGGPVPGEYASKGMDWIFGCDICQEVCPYNQAVPETTEPQFTTCWSRIDPAELARMDDETFQAYFWGSCLLRAGREHLQDLNRDLAAAAGKSTDK